MSSAETPQLVPSGSSNGFIKVIKDKDGNKLNPPQPFAISGLVSIDEIKDTADLKEINGGKAYAIALRSGKKKIEFSFTTDLFTGAMLNALYYGEEIQQNKAQHPLIDMTGHIVPSGASLDFKIQNTIAINLGRWDADISVEIWNGSAYVQATKTDSYPPNAGEYRQYWSKIYQWAQADVGKKSRITYSSNGTIIKTVLNKIPASLTYDVTLCSKITKVVNAATLIADKYNPTTVIADNTHYQASSGILVLKADTTLDSGKSLMINHVTDNNAVVSTISVLPASSYSIYIDAQGSAIYTGDEGISLVTNIDSAMTDVSVGDSLTKTDYLIDTTFNVNNSNGYAAGHTGVIACNVGTGTLAAGKKIMFGADVTPYIIATATGSPNTTAITLTSPLVNAIVDNTVIKTPAVPTSGLYTADRKGCYTLASADNGDKVRLKYGQDYYYIALQLPEGATFIEDLGVRSEGGMPFQSIAKSDPLAITTNQYFANEQYQAYYFDYTNSGDKVFIDYLVETQDGTRIVINNDLAGKSPTFSAFLTNQQDGEKTSVIYRNCKCKGTGIPMKQDPSQMKFDCEAFANRVTNIVGEISTSS